MFTQPFFQAQIKLHQSSVSLAFIGNALVTGKFPAQRASNAENISIGWRHYAKDQDI